MMEKAHPQVMKLDQLHQINLILSTIGNINLTPGNTITGGIEISVWGVSTFLITPLHLHNF